MSTKARSLILDPGAHNTRSHDREPRVKAMDSFQRCPGRGPSRQPSPSPRASAVPCVARQGPGAASLPELRAWPQMLPPTHPAVLGAPRVAPLPHV